EREIKRQETKLKQNKFIKKASEEIKNERKIEKAEAVPAPNYIPSSPPPSEQPPALPSSKPILSPPPNVPPPPLPSSGAPSLPQRRPLPQIPPQARHLSTTATMMESMNKGGAQVKVKSPVTEKGEDVKIERALPKEDKARLEVESL